MGIRERPVVSSLDGRRVEMVGWRRIVVPRGVMVWVLLLLVEVNLVLV